MPEVPAGGFATPEADHIVGAIDAEFAITEGGSASYNIPIKVPPGTLGVQPKLSLSYSSHRGLDLGGVGFGLSGLSSIERCAKTIARDGEAGEVFINGEDRFCLDGVRLVKVGEGTYGEPGVLYHTEVETWSRIESIGDCRGIDEEAGKQQMSGPCSFVVTHKNGSTAEYGGGNSAECSSITNRPDEPTARVSWPLTKVRDLRGNTIEIEYQLGGRRVCIPKVIYYTGNDITQTAPSREVRFQYDSLIGYEVQYLANLRKYLNQRLVTIRTYIVDEEYDGEKLIKEYRFDYGTSPDSLRHRLEELYECDGEGSCLPPTVFQWQDTDWMDHTYTPSNNSPGTNNLTYSGDFNGDGRIDFLQFPTPIDAGPGWQFLSQPGTNSMELTQTGWLHAPDRSQYGEQFHTGDINGDGFTDLFQIGLPTEGWAIYLGTPNGLSLQAAHQGYGLNCNHVIYLGDFDGDGRVDLFTHANRKRPGGMYETDDYYGWRAYQWNGSSFTLVNEDEFDPLSDNWNDFLEGNVDKMVRFHLGDYSGDGRVDFLATKMVDSEEEDVYYTAWKLYISNGSGFDHARKGIWPHDGYNFTPGDYNGDGLTDLILTGHRYDFGDQHVQTGYLMMISSGTDFVPEIHLPETHTIDVKGAEYGPFTVEWGATGSHPSWVDQLEVANFNDDGKDDILVTFANKWFTDGPPGVVNNYRYDEVKMYMGYDKQLLYRTAKYFPADKRHFAADFNGNGRTDLYYSTGSTPIYRRSGDTNRADLLVEITDGYKAKTEITYYPMTNNLVYEKGEGAQYPTRDYISTRFLPAKVRKRDGGDGFYDYWHRYVAAKTDLEGRGFLGFAQTHYKTEFDDISIYTDYRQDWPYSGLIHSSKKRYANNTLEEQKYDYQLITHPDFDGPYQVALSEKWTKKYDLGGQLVNTGVVEYEYDDFGNVTLEVDRPDTSDSDTDRSIFKVYHNDLSNWQLGYILQNRVYQTWSKPLFYVWMQYDSKMNVKFKGRWDQADYQWLGNNYTYTDNGSVSTATDPLGGVTHYKYDKFGFLWQTTNPLGHQTVQETEAGFGVETRRTDPNGHETRVVIDGFGRTSEVWGQNADNDWVELKRFSLTTVGYGYVTQEFSRRDWKVSNPVWDWQEEFYDALNRRYKIRRRGLDKPIVVDVQYHQLELVGKQSQPHFEGEPALFTRYHYDVKKRPVKTTFPSGEQNEITYFDFNNSMVKREPNGVETTMQQDARGKLIRMVDGTNYTMWFNRDPLGRVVAIRKTASQKIETEYDTLGRRISSYDPATGTRTFEYDVYGQLTAEVDAKNQRVERAYDALGRTTTKTYVPATSGEPVRVMEYGYDAAGDIGYLTSVESFLDGVSEWRYDLGYDPYGHQTETSLTIDQEVFVSTRGYDPSGREIAGTYPDGSVLRSIYNSAGVLEQLDLDDYLGGSSTLARYGEYNSSLKPGLLTYGNNTATCYLYSNTTGLLQNAETSWYSGEIENPCRSEEPGKEEKPLLSHKFDWDKVGNLTEIVDMLEPGLSQSFGYSDRGELTTAQGAYGQHVFAYDNFGNRTQKNGTTYNYAHDRLVSSSDGLAAYQDANGNMVSKYSNGGAWQYVWDVADRLAQVTKDGEVTQFAYDYQNRRLKKVDPDGAVTYYITPRYEVLRRPGEPELRTKYVSGLAGQVAQLTNEVSATAALQKPGHHFATLASLQDDGTVMGGLKAAHYRLMSLLGPNQLVDHLKRVFWLVLGLAFLALLAQVAATLYRQRQRTFRRYPRFAYLSSPIVLAIFVVTYGVGTPALASTVPGDNGAGRPVTGRYYLHQNYLGSTSMVTDKAGEVVSRFEYEPFGAVYQPESKGLDIVRSKFTGKELDTQNEIYYFGSRYYDPEIGRFISADVGLGGPAVRAASYNRFAYATNNPVTYVDPSGKCAELVLGITALVGAVVGALIAGTGGKILTDPGNAFDDFSWSRAIVGAWCGLVAGVLSYAIGTIGAVAGAKILGVPISNLLSGALNGGVYEATMAWSGGERDFGRLTAYFGVGILHGFVSGLLPAIGTKYSTGARLMAEVGVSMGTSAIKYGINSKNGFTYSYWALRVGFDGEGEANIGFNWTFLGGQGIRVLANAYDGSWSNLANSWDWNKLSFGVKNDGLWGQIASKFTGDSYGPPHAGSMNGLASAVVKGVAKFIFAQYMDATGNAGPIQTFGGIGVDKAAGAGWGKVNGAIGDYGKKQSKKKNPWDD